VANRIVAVQIALGDRGNVFHQFGIGLHERFPFAAFEQSQIAACYAVTGRPENIDQMTADVAKMSCYEDPHALHGASPDCHILLRLS
jgi:hypothetical protein